jgi:hypothetical protein
MKISSCLRKKWLIVLYLFVLTLYAGSGESGSPIDSNCLALNREAVTLLSAERSREADDLLSKLITHADDSRRDWLCQGVTWNNLAQARQRLGLIDQAEIAAGRSIEALEKAFPGDSSRSLIRRPLHLLISIAMEKAEYTRAEKLLTKVEGLPNGTARDLAVENGLRIVVETTSGHLTEAERFGRCSIEYWE